MAPETSPPRKDNWNQYIFLKYFGRVVIKKVSSKLYAFDCFFMKNVRVLIKICDFYFSFSILIFTSLAWDSKTSLLDVLMATLVLLFYNNITSANMHLCVCVCIRQTERQRERGRDRERQRDRDGIGGERMCLRASMYI